MKPPHSLKKVELMDLQLDVVDCTHILDELIEVCAERITTLKLVNASRVPMEMLGVSLFVNLKVLIISPHNLGEDLVECLGKIFISIFASHQLKPILPILS